MPRYYRLTEEQFGQLTRLVDGARMLCFGMTGPYTMTPYGPLIDLVQPLDTYVISAQPSSEVADA